MTEPTTTSTTPVLDTSLESDAPYIEELVPASKRKPRHERGERPLLEVKGLKTSFYTRDGVVRAVDGIDFHVDRGEIMGLVGESGCGKSVTSLSILRLVARPGRIDAGEILFDGQDLLTLSDDAMRRIRGDRISMIFQQPTSSLNPVWDVGRQIEEVIASLEKEMKEAARALNFEYAAELRDEVNELRKFAPKSEVGKDDGTSQLGKAKALYDRPKSGRGKK